MTNVALFLFSNVAVPAPAMANPPLSKTAAVVPSPTVKLPVTLLEVTAAPRLAPDALVFRICKFA